MRTNARVHRPRKCFPVVPTGVPGIVLLRYHAGVYRVTHLASGKALGPTLGLAKARLLARQLAPLMDWTLPAERIMSDVQVARRREAETLIRRWDAASWRRRGYTRRERNIYAKEERRERERAKTCDPCAGKQHGRKAGVP